MSKLLAKYEIEPEVVQYLLNALNALQIRGIDQANSMLKVWAILQNPLNKEELEKARKEEEVKALELASKESK